MLLSASILPAWACADAPCLDVRTLALALAGLTAFFFALLYASRFLPGREVMGFPQPDGARKRYRLNGMSLWVLTHMVVIAGTLHFDLSLSPLVTRLFWPLFVAANLFSIAWALLLYVRGRARLGDASASAPGLLGAIRDFWMGVERNPEWRGVDLKLFAYQPSLIGLWLFVLGFGYLQYESFGYLTPQMVLYQACWWLYLTTHYHHEPGLLSMWDIVAERFGFMLVWGDLALVPFAYCLAGWYIAAEPTPMATPLVLAIGAMFLFGLWVFRGANAQKHRFKVDRDARIWGQPPRLVGGRLLISGFWGIGRKLNYTGEIVLYLAIALCSGCGSYVPYLVPLWLLSLLTHRAGRDDRRCRSKYGALWDEYCQHARFRMFPFLY